MTNNINQQREIKIMIDHIVRELILEFGKSKEEAMQLVKTADVDKSLAEDPIGFHESPHDWALSILTDNDDYEALEKYFHH